MIKLEELEKISNFKRLSIKNTERDYLLELLLFVIYKYVGRKLVFKGGTALYKLHGLNRFSEDLDFTLIDSKLDLQKLLKNVISDLRNINVHAKIKEFDDYKNQKNIKLEIKGPLYKGNKDDLSLITINISLREKPMYEAEHKQIFSQYTEITSFDVFVMNLNEIFADKIRCIFVRDKARDVYDAWFLLKKEVQIDINIITKKLRLSNKEYNKEELISKIEEKRKDWELDLKRVIIGELPKFEGVLKEIKSALS